MSDSERPSVPPAPRTEPMRTASPKGTDGPEGNRLSWWRQGWGVAGIGVVCLLVGVGIGLSAKSGESKHTPSAAQLRAQAEARTAQIHREEAEKVAKEKAEAATRKKEAHERAVAAHEAAQKAREEAAQRRREKEHEEAEARRKHEEENKTYTGEGQQSLGTIVVPVSSTLTWECPSCATAQEGIGANFIVENAGSDGKDLGVNGLKQTHGVSPIEPGRYHTVVVNTQAGAWTIHIAPGE